MVGIVFDFPGITRVLIVAQLNSSQSCFKEPVGLINSAHISEPGSRLSRGQKKTKAPHSARMARWHLKCWGLPPGFGACTRPKGAHCARSARTDLRTCNVLASSEGTQQIVFADFTLEVRGQPKQQTSLFGCGCPT